MTVVVGGIVFKSCTKRSDCSFASSDVFFTTTAEISYAIEYESQEACDELGATCNITKK